MALKSWPNRYKDLPDFHKKYYENNDLGHFLDQLKDIKSARGYKSKRKDVRFAKMQIDYKKQQLKYKYD